MNRGLLVVLVVLLSLVLAWVALFWKPGPGSLGTPKSLELAEAPAGGDFTLQSHKGSVSLQSLRGKVVALYFGYTMCPDVCPTSLGYLSMALNELSPGELSAVQGLFISVDPERDSLQRLKTYGEYFNTHILGITGSPEDIAMTAGRYGAAYRMTRQDTEMGYIVDHTSDTYLVDRKGRLARTLPHGTPPEEVLSAIRALLGRDD